MNETDCVLQGKRLLCILQIKKKSQCKRNGIYLPDPAGKRRQEINVSQRHFSRKPLQEVMGQRVDAEYKPQV